MPVSPACPTTSHDICTDNTIHRYHAGMERPPLLKMLIRGAFRRCAWCGGRGAFFTGWTKKADHCQTCGVGWRRDYEGYELGAAAVAAIICMGPLMLVLGGVMALTWPDFPIPQLLISLGAGGIILPILLYPSSYTMWQAIDILMRPVEPKDFADGQPVPST